ncbi:hypothetical protein Cpir12675_000556 [Ceratocystis pirilliformis]|uniref:Uncharacterized protein n=1 Tax=Ceratocystis pirilliformis TaxID=259994 RepID=A0ABR3ZL81_9PEZI
MRSLWDIKGTQSTGSTYLRKTSSATSSPLLLSRGSGPGSSQSSTVPLASPAQTPSAPTPSGDPCGATDTPDEIDTVSSDVDMIHESQPTHPIRSRTVNRHPRIRRTAAQVAAGIYVQATREQRNLAPQSRQSAEAAARAAQAAANATQTASNVTESSVIANEQANRDALNARTSVDQTEETARLIDARAAEHLLAIERASRATQVEVSIEEPPSPPCPTVHPASIEHCSGETHGVVPRRSQRLAEQNQWRSCYGLRTPVM